MSKGNLPESVYEALPYVYGGAGIIAIITLHNWMALISGLALMSAGVIIWSMRHRYRSEFMHSDGQIDFPNGFDDQNTGTQLIQIQWRSSFDCGNSVIDAQHRRLFGLGNELINTVSSDKPSDDVELLLEELISHITDHFCTEEAILARTKHPISAEHQNIHRALLAKAIGLRDRFLNGSLVTSELVGFIVYDVITDHITKEDLKFAVSDS